MALLALLSVGAPTSLPLVDAGERDDGAFVESSHDPATCLRVHDHAACSQLLHSLKGMWPLWLVTLRPVRATGPLPGPSEAPTLRPWLLLHASRAPPTLAL